MSNRLIPFIFLLAMIAAACQSGSKNAEDEFVTEESLGLRKTDLYSENSTEGDQGVFEATAPGQGVLLERSFENAPPLIPHTTQGFLPIKANLNICLSCHMPNVAEATKSTPIPKSHFMDFRPEIVEEGGLVKAYDDDETQNTVTTVDLGDQLSHTRFNCSQCHVPQANITVELKNNFEADFRSEELKSKSNFADVVDEGVK